MRTLLATILCAALALVSHPALAVTVRTDHPRLLFGDGSGFGTTVAQFTARCNGTDPDYAHRCQYLFGGQGNPDTMPQGVGDAESLAAGYLLWGGDQRCESAATWLLANLPADGPTDAPDCTDLGGAHGFISSYSSAISALAIVRDWCDASLQSSLESQLETRIDTWMNWLMANYGANATGPCPEGADVFHDDYANVVDDVAWGALILAGGSFDADAQMGLAWADQNYKQVLIPAHVYVDDWWPEGFTYIQPTLGGLSSYAAVWSTATDENIYDWVKTNGNDLFTKYIYFFLYAQRPDTNLVYFGDTTSTKQSDQLFFWPLVATFNYGLSSPLAQGLMQSITAATTQQVGFCYDVGCEQGWQYALMYDSSLDGAAQPASTLPTARWLSQGGSDIAVLRSGWGPDDTYVWMSCGDYFGAHQHDEAGSFQIFRHGMLTGPTGDYDQFGPSSSSQHWDRYYSQHSVHANTIAVQTPNELFPDTLVVENGPSANVNDGGQRPLRRTDDNGLIGSFSSTNLDAYLEEKKSGNLYETGDMTAFSHSSCYDYVACDVTAAYQSPGFTTDDNPPKVSEVSRQFVFVPPEIVIVFDRVESTDASYQKRVLFHASGTGVMPQVSGNGFTIDNNGGRLIGVSLLPAGASLNVVTNFDVAGTSYPPDLSELPPNEPEMGGNRVEVVPAAPALRDYFLHVFDATDPTTSTLNATVQDGPDTSTATVVDGPNTYVVSFNKTGTLGGHITVTGSVSCDQDLGASASSGTGGGGAGGAGSGTGGAGHGGTGGASGSPGMKAGCGCRAAGGEEGRAGFTLLLAALALARRRARALRG